MDLHVRPRGEAERCPWCHEAMLAEAPPPGGEPIPPAAEPGAPSPLAGEPVEPAAVEPAAPAVEPTLAVEPAAVGGPVGGSASASPGAPAGSGAVARCEGCGTAAHAECMAENGGCSVQGCAKQAPGKQRPKLAIRLEPKAPRPAQRPVGRRIVRWVAAAVALVATLASAGTALVATHPLIEPRLFQRSTSPDRDHEVLLWRRVAWPPWGGADPWLLVHVELRRMDGALLQRREARVRASRLEAAAVRWGRDLVYVTGFGPGEVVSFTPPSREELLPGKAPTRPAPRDATTTMVPRRGTTSIGLQYRQRDDGGHEVLDGGRWVPHHPADHGTIEGR